MWQSSWTKNTRNTVALQVLWQQRLDDLEPDGVVKTWSAALSVRAWLERTQVGAVVAAWSLGAPERTGGPGGPADVFCFFISEWFGIEKGILETRTVVLGHVLDGLAQVVVAHGVVIAAEFSDHGFEVVLLQPAGEVGEVGGEALVADLVLTGVVVVEVLVDVNGGVLDWVLEHVQVFGGWSVAAGRLVPGVTTGESVARCDDQLLCASCADAVDGGLVVLQDQLGWHVVWLVHDTEDDFWVVDVTRRKLVPEGLELCGSRSGWVGGVTNDRASERLRGWVVVTHVYECQEISSWVIRMHCLQL